MNISDIAIRVIEQLMNKEQLAELFEGSSGEDSDGKEIPIPENFPKEIQNPIIKDTYGDEDENPESTDGEYIILGSYTPMNSPGIITFYVNNIARYSGSLIRKMVKAGNYFSFDLFVNTVSYVVENVLLHESFHYYCDYKRQILASKFDRDLEEALAVAHSYLNIANNRYSRIRMDLWMSEYRQFEREFYKQYKIRIRKDVHRKNYLDAFKLHHFSSYKSKGYRDWSLYVGSNSYETDFFNYIKDVKLDSLLKNGVNVNDIHNETMVIGYKGAVIRVK